jgi:FMN phosphatase YigB (HAD superfamily)
MKHIFLDFDRTLFDTEQFYNSLELTYIEGIIAGQLGADFSRFIYPDVLSFIRNVQQSGFTCHLVTFGRRQVQECKFKLSGLEPYFDQTFYVEQGSKADTVKKYFDSGVSCEKDCFY